MTYSPRERSVIVLESSYAYEGRASRIDSRIRSMCPRMASAPITTGPSLSSWCGCVLHTTYYVCRSTTRGGDSVWMHAPRTGSLQGRLRGSCVPYVIRRSSRSAGPRISRESIQAASGGQSNQTARAIPTAEAVLSCGGRPRPPDGSSGPRGPDRHRAERSHRRRRGGGGGRRRGDDAVRPVGGGEGPMCGGLLRAQGPAGLPVERRRGLRGGRSPLQARREQAEGGSVPDAAAHPAGDVQP